mmetsp:Transcript_33178/g.101956  ORF Transcript_33178/g.101956 Transcript_33178/m.101956 type:complete len:130 (+) Transcript_33178:329-718(+)
MAGRRGTVGSPQSIHLPLDAATTGADEHALKAACDAAPPPARPRKSSLKTLASPPRELARNGVRFDEAPAPPPEQQRERATTDPVSPVLPVRALDAPALDAAAAKAEGFSPLRRADSLPLGTGGQGVNQ